MSLVQHRTIVGADLHNSKATPFTGSPTTFTPTETGVFYVRTDVTPNLLYRSTGTVAGAIALVGSPPESAGVTDHGALTGLSDDDHPQYFNQSRGDARYILQSAFAESVDDRVSVLLQPGTGIGLTYDDTAGTLTIATSGGVGSGSVTSVGLAAPSIFAVSGTPVTGSGTLTLTLATQAANTVFAGATSGGLNTPAFRSLVEADIPSLAIAKIANLQSNLNLRPTSDITGITGADQITNIISLTQAEYDAIVVKSATTLYVIA